MTKKQMMNNNTTGLALGLVFVGMHLLWVISVGIGLAGWLIKWWHSVHLFDHPVTLLNLSFVNILLGLAGAFICGYVLGWVYSWLYNWLS